MLDQFNDNRYEAITLNISIPIYNNHIFRSQIDQYKLRSVQSTHDKNSNDELLIKTLNNETSTFKNSLEQYKFSQNIMQDAQKIFNLSNKHFLSGKINTFEYLYKKEQLYDAQEDLIRSKYSVYLNRLLLLNHFAAK